MELPAAASGSCLTCAATSLTAGSWCPCSRQPATTSNIVWLYWSLPCRMMRPYSAAAVTSTSVLQVLLAPPAGASSASSTCISRRFALGL